MTDPAAGETSTAPPAEGDHRIREIFFPYTDEKSVEMCSSSETRVAYYTTAETAFHLLKNKQLWLRNTVTMNDYSEVAHGFECLKKAWESDAGKHFRESLDRIFPDLTKTAAERFDAWLPSIRQDTYIACFSEHLPSENKNGRLRCGAPMEVGPVSP